MPTKVRKDFEEVYQEYLKVLDDREKEGRKPISFDDYLWSKAEKAVEKKKHKAIPVNPEKFDRILKKIGRRKL